MSIKANIKGNSPPSFQVEGEDEVELFKGMARVQELFGSTKCGKCHGQEIQYVCRKDSEDNDWLELVCQKNSCRAKLSYGQTKTPKGKVYPKTRFSHLSPKVQEGRMECQAYADKHDGWLPSGGWFIFKPKDK